MDGRHVFDTSTSHGGTAYTDSRGASGSFAQGASGSFLQGPSGSFSSSQYQDVYGDESTTGSRTPTRERETLPLSTTTVATVAVAHAIVSVGW